MNGWQSKKQMAASRLPDNKNICNQLDDIFNCLNSQYEALLIIKSEIAILREQLEKQKYSLPHDPISRPFRL